MVINYYESEEIDFGAVEYREYTVREIYEALEKNGLKHLRGEWMSTDSKGKVVGGCVLGQGAFNLNVPYSTDAPDADAIGNLEEELNQFQAAEEHWKGNTSKAGTLITVWNDAVQLKSDGTHYAKTRYELATYQDVLDKARAILEPHFDKTVKLPHYEY